MTTVPLYTYKLLNSQNQLEIGLLNHLAQQVRMIFIFNIQYINVGRFCSQTIVNFCMRLSLVLNNYKPLRWRQNLPTHTAVITLS